MAEWFMSVALMRLMAFPTQCAEKGEMYGPIETSHNTMYLSFSVSLFLGISLTIIFSIQMPMLQCLFATEAPLTLGRLNYDDISDQTRMEILIERVLPSSKRTLQDEHGAYLDVCEWKFTECDASDNVTLVRLNGDATNLKAVINFSYIPPYVKHFEACWKALEGTIETSELPAVLEELHLWGNMLTGTLDMTALPRGLKEMNAAENLFTGSCDLRALPPALVVLLLNENNFRGSLHLDCLPDTLVDLHLSENRFEGSVCLSKLPASLRMLSIMENILDGKFRLVNAPLGISVDASRNFFESPAIVQKNISAVYLGGNCTFDVRDEDGNTHSNEEAISLIGEYDDEDDDDEEE